MPRMDQAPPTDILVKQLLVGDGRIGKTRYAAESARHFKTLYLNGDANASGTLRQMPVELQRNIYMMDMADTVLGGIRDSKFVESMQEFTTNIKVRWNDALQRVARRADTDEIWEITPSQMDNTCLLVLDGWTSLCDSMKLQAARANNLILEDATTAQMRPVYQSAGLKATAILQCLKALRCHVLVLAHPDEYEHKTKPEGRRIQDVKELDMIVDWTKLIPKSVSKPHGFSMGGNFTDVGWMELSPGGERRINFKVKNDRVSGGHFADSKSTIDYSFANLVKEVGGLVPDGSQPIERWLRIIPAGEAVESTAKVLDGTTGQPIKGMSNLFAKKG